MNQPKKLSNRERKSIRLKHLLDETSTFHHDLRAQLTGLTMFANQSTFRHEGVRPRPIFLDHLFNLCTLTKAVEEEANKYVMKAKDLEGIPVELSLRRANRKTSKLVRVLERHWKTLDQIITSLEKDPEAQKIRMGKNQDREVLPLVRDAHSKLSKMLSAYRLTRHGKVVSGGLTHLAGVIDKVAMQFPSIRFHPAPREMFDLMKFNPTPEGEQFAHHHVSSNALELERAFYNLCKNAKEAGARNIWREINDFGGTLAVNFRDDGKGIPEEHHDNLFQKGNTFGKKGGTGLGLWSIRRKLRTFGADIGLTRSNTSGANRGTWFTLMFPKLTTFTGKKLPLLKK